MSKVINLRQARKARAKDARRSEASARAARFGRTKAERLREDAEAEKTRRNLDGHERE